MGSNERISLAHLKLKINYMNVKVCNEWGVPNQFVIFTDKGQFFQSYDSVIVFIPHGVYTKNQTEKPNRIQLDKDTWNYSATTSKYRNKFLNETTKETQAKIKSGLYKLVDLNKDGIHS